MDHTTRGIVIHTIRYTDSSLIVRIFTPDAGLKSFMVRSGKTQRSARMNLVQPLTLVEFETSLRESSQLQPLKNLRIAHPWQAIPFEPGKSTIILFLNEVLYRTIPEGYANDQLFRFLWNSLILLDDAFDEKNFHLWCLLEITRHYGFYPQLQEGSNVFFDLHQGIFTDERVLHPHYMDEEESAALFAMLDKEWPQVQDMMLHGALRKNLLLQLVQYIQIHLENLREIKSLQVLHDVFH